MSLNFGTDNIIYIPEGGRLNIFDVYRWERRTLDVQRSTVRLRSSAMERLKKEIARCVKDLDKHAETRSALVENKVALKAFLKDLTESEVNTITVPFAPQTESDMTWWVRLSDHPVESFHSEDYEETTDGLASELFARRLYGSCSITAGEQHEIPFPAEGDKAAFEWLAPFMECESIDPTEPLPIAREFCGASGVSAFGNSVNIDTKGELAATHLGCCPIRIIGGGTFATLYFSMLSDVRARVMSQLTAGWLDRIPELLKQSKFQEYPSGMNWRIFERNGDVVHVYENLEGKESAGYLTMPPFLLVASAGGDPSPQLRELLLDSILDVLKATA